MLNYQAFKRAAHQSAQEAKRRADEAYPIQLAAVYREAEKIATQRASAEASQAYLTDLLAKIAHLLRKFDKGGALLVEDCPNLVTIQDKSEPRRESLSLAVDSVVCRGDNDEGDFTTLAIAIQHKKGRNIEYQTLLPIKHGMKTLAGEDRRLLCDAINARIDVILSHRSRLATAALSR